MEKFHYVIERGPKKGTEIVLPPFDAIPTGIIRRTRNLPGEQQMFAVLEAYLGDDSPEMSAIDAIETGELEPFVKAWQEHAGVSLGESKAS